MTVGDLVKLKTNSEWPMAIIVDVDSTSWFWVLQSDGVKRLWPAHQMELVLDCHMAMPESLRGNEL